MLFLCIKDLWEGEFLEGATYSGHYVNDRMINILSSDGHMVTFGEEVRAAMVEDPENEDNTDV